MVVTCVATKNLAKTLAAISTQKIMAESLTVDSTARRKSRQPILLIDKATKTVNEAPTAAASPGVNKPTYIPKTTTIKITTIGITVNNDVIFSRRVKEGPLGPSAGFNRHLITT